MNAVLVLFKIVWKLEMVQESVTEIISEIERIAYIKKSRDFSLLSILKNTASPASTYSFLDCGAQVLIQEKITEY